jgi:hypothetical protein
MRSLEHFHETSGLVQSSKGPVMSMYFYDDTDDWPEYKIIKDEIQRLEMAHLEVSKELQWHISRSAKNYRKLSLPLCLILQTMVQKPRWMGLRRN